MTAAFRTPYSATASGIATLGKPRAKQTVHVVVKCFHEGRLERFVVLVVPHGAETGEYYTIRNERTLDALKQGATPAYLELEPSEPEDDELDEAEREFSIRHHTAAMRRAGAFGEIS